MGSLLNSPSISSQFQNRLLLMKVCVMMSHVTKEAIEFSKSIKIPSIFPTTQDNLNLNAERYAKLRVHGKRKQANPPSFNVSSSASPCHLPCQSCRLPLKLSMMDQASSQRVSRTSDSHRQLEKVTISNDQTCHDRIHAYRLWPTSGHPDSDNCAELSSHELESQCSAQG